MRIGIIVMFAILNQIAIYGQNSCATDEVNKHLESIDSEIASRKLAMEAQIEKFKTSASTRAAAKFIIPVVFHVIHTNGPENISRAQILDQIRVLNQDFRFTNTGKSKIRSQFAGLGADCEIEFRLAAIDPNGNCTDGVQRFVSNLGIDVSQTTEDVKFITGAKWDYKKYLNIWVVSSIQSSSGGTGTVLGYAVFPWATGAARDGIVMRHDRVGTIGTALNSDSGRTLTHEIGHWLGLFHTFEGDCVTGDKVDDTPPVTGTFVNANCPATGNSCTNDVPDKYDMWEDYMDYSDGNCMQLFTAGQKTRMHGFLNQSPRNTIWTTANLQATGVNLQDVAPIAMFSASTRKICAGKPVVFSDLSCKGTVTARSWSLPGSSNPNATNATPIAVYQTPGKYKVTLTVQNTKGSNTSSIDNYIEVVSAAAPRTPTYYQSFDNGDPKTAGEINFIIPLAANQWTWETNAGSSGSFSYKAAVTSNDDAGKVYSFTLPSVNLSGLKGLGPKLSFMCAYAPNGSTAYERLKVYMSADCENNWFQIYERSGGGLYYPGATNTTNFKPTTASQWRMMQVPLNAYDTVKNATIRFDIISAGINPVYIDDINIGLFLTGTQVSKIGDKQIQVYPNPAKNKANLVIYSENTDEVQIQLVSTKGQLVTDLGTKKVTGGYTTLEINNNANVYSGLYYIRIKTNDGIIVKPITFAP